MVLNYGVGRSRTQSVTVTEFGLRRGHSCGFGWSRRGHRGGGVLPAASEVRMTWSPDVQVFRRAVQHAATTAVRPRPADGEYAAVVVVDSIVPGNPRGSR